MRLPPGEWASYGSIVAHGLVPHNAMASAATAPTAIRGSFSLPAYRTFRVDIPRISVTMSNSQNQDRAVVQPLKDSTGPSQRI